MTNKLKNIPDSMKELEQWVAWKTVINGKASKIPLNPNNGVAASVNEPATWTTFENATNYYQSGKADGVGFVFTNDDPFIGIDFDDCIVDGKILPETEYLIKNIGSYTEISPSGEGLHIIIKGKLPAGGHRKGKIEVYDKKRFFTVTGDTLTDTYQEIIGVDNILDILFQQKVTKPDISDEDAAMLRQALKNQKFNSLWSGNFEAYSSQSEADLALCGLLGHYCNNNPVTIDRLFRMSGLFRSKWDERHSFDGKTYGQITIDKATAGIQDTSQAPSQQVKEPVSITFCSFMDIYTANAQPEWIIKDFIPKGEPTLISASGGVGKSMFSLFIAHSLALDTYEYLLFDEFPMVKTGISSLFLQTENSNAQLNFRMRKIAGDNIEPLSRIFAPVFNGSSLTSGKTFQEAGRNKTSENFEDWFYSLINSIQDHTKQKIDLVWFDPLISFCGCNENDNTEMRQNLDVITRVSQKCDVTPIVIHHNAKDSKNYRGASAIFDWTRNLISLNKILIPEQSFEDGVMKIKQVPAIEIAHDKCNVGRMFDKFKMRMNDNFTFTRINEDSLDHKTTRICEDVQQALQDLNGYAESQNVLIKQYREVDPVSTGTAQKNIKLALEYGFIKKTQEGNKYHYELPNTNQLRLVG